MQRLCMRLLASCLLVIGLSTGAALANTITIESCCDQGALEPEATIGLLSDGTLTLVGYEDPNTDAGPPAVEGSPSNAVESTSTATAFDIGNSSEANELATFKTILTNNGEDPNVLLFAAQTDTGGVEEGQFDLYSRYFSLTLGSLTAFFRCDDCGSTFTIAYEQTGGAGGLSHITQYVPVPAALPLLLSALGGLGVFRWVRQRSAN